MLIKTKSCLLRRKIVPLEVCKLLKGERVVFKGVKKAKERESFILPSMKRRSVKTASNRINCSLKEDDFVIERNKKAALGKPFHAKFTEAKSKDDFSESLKMRSHI